jgi:hypothetical protein
MRNFNTTKYASNRGLPVFYGEDITSGRRNGSSFFPNARASELKHKGLVEAFDYYDAKKDPKKGDKLLYLRRGGDILHVTVDKNPTNTELELINDSNGKHIVLEPLEHGYSYMLFKPPTRGIRSQTNREESLKQGPFRKRPRFSGGRTRKRR